GPTRDQLRRELRRWLTAAGVPVLLVTHDRGEAQSLADSLVVMDGGRVVQSGRVEDVFSRPATPDIARAVGADNVLPARVVAAAGGLTEAAVGAVRVWARGEVTPSGAAFVVIRGEEVVLAREDGGPGGTVNRWPGAVKSLAREGPLVRVVLDCGFPLTALVTPQACRELRLAEGESVWAAVEPGAVHLMSSA
ncbi:MAG TPA: TOBE domain-containing protein, partial [Gemmataceae bacterium]|nr:TOBE domain-containing protein [Gemmataceae bacterium]